MLAVNITSGMYALGFQKNKEVSVLIDLGTNGEMAIGNADKIYIKTTIKETICFFIHMD